MCTSIAVGSIFSLPLAPVRLTRASVGEVHSGTSPKRSSISVWKPSSLRRASSGGTLVRCVMSMLGMRSSVGGTGSQGGRPGPVGRASPGRRERTGFNDRRGESVFMTTPTHLSERKGGLQGPSVEHSILPESAWPHLANPAAAAPYAAEAASTPPPYKRLTRV